MQALSKISKLAQSAGIALSVACSAASGGAPQQEVDGAEPETERGRSALAAGATVADAVSGGCSTASVKGLSEQIVAQMNCLVPNALAALPSRPNLTKSDATFAYLQLPARDALVQALDANPGMTMGVNSMFRTVAQQYLLSKWGSQKKCGVALAAKPGNSNHESGLAVDTSQFASWKSALEARGFSWFGSSDKVHFDYVGSGKVSLKGMDVKAFQILWNANNPNDTISEDGIYGAQTELRLAKSPAAGFPIGANCSSSSSPTSPAQPPASPSPTPASCAGNCNGTGPVAGSDPNCYCDSVCVTNNDCCADYQSACGGSSSSSPTPTGPTCDGLCGSSSAAPGSNPACYCDSQCVSLGDCCADASSLCGY